jgi:hypothetical protein
MSMLTDASRFFSDIPDDLRALGWCLTKVVPYHHMEDPADSDKVKVFYERPMPRNAVEKREYYVANDSRGGTWSELRDWCIEGMRTASING